MKGDGYTHLHVHSEYSLLDGANRVKDIAKLAAQSGHPAVALTDHGNMSGAVEFAAACKKEGVKPLIGVEMYTSGDRSRFDKDPQKDRENYHLVLLAKNETGYRNLVKLTSLSNTEGFYYKPRIDHELLSRYADGLVGTSACLGSEVCSQILVGDLKHAKETAAKYRDILGAENFFIEIQDHNQPEDKIVTPELIRIGNDLGLRVVATNDVHYAKREDADPHDTLLCVSTSSRKSDTKRMRYPSDTFYWRSRAEMEALFPTETLDNTLLVAEMCDFDLKTGELILPHYDVPEGHTYDSWLEHLVWEGAMHRYPELTALHRERIQHELGVISRKGYSAYFLIVEDFVRWAHEREIPARCRGSAAGSVVAYCLGISRIDPMEYGLLFERFFYEERITPPDIDLDFADYRREDVLEHCREKYGADHVANIITFGTLGSRAAIRDVARVLSVPISVSDQLSRLIPVKQGKPFSLDKTLAEVGEFKKLYDGDRQVREVVDTARSIEGLSRHAGVHAAGVVITPGPVSDYCPIQRAKGSSERNGIQIVTQYDMNRVSDIGLLKMDFLGLRTLTVVDQCVKLIRERHPGMSAFSVDDIGDADAKTFRMLQAGHTAGVFQLESSGMRQLVQDVRPERIADIIPLVALYRPGPLGNGDTGRFIRRRHGSEPAGYTHPCLEPILKDTYGIFVYQDQILKVAMRAAGMGALEADGILRAMSKKVPEKMQALKPKFLEGIERTSGVPKATAERIWEQMESFAAYGFNQNHSGAYAVLSYETAWLKANFPAEFMVALMTSVKDDLDKVALYVDECKRVGIPVKLPDVNVSGVGFTIDPEGAVSFGFSAIRGVGEKAAAAVLKARRNGPFKDLFDFCMRVDIGNCHATHVKAMIRAGCFDALHDNRAQCDAWVDACYASAKRQRYDQETGQLGLFGARASHEAIVPPMPPVEPWDPRELLRVEKEATGLYISGHPMDAHAKALAAYDITGLDAVGDYDDGDVLVVAGLVTEVKEHITKVKKEPMAFVTIEDPRGRTGVTIFPKTWAKCAHLVRPDDIIIVRGKVQVKDRKASGEDEVEEREVEILADVVKDVGDAEDVGAQGASPESFRALFVDLTDASERDIARMKDVFLSQRGENELVMRRWGKDQKSSLRIAANRHTMNQIANIIGREMVWLEKEAQ